MSTHFIEYIPETSANDLSRLNIHPNIFQTSHISKIIDVLTIIKIIASTLLQISLIVLVCVIIFGLTRSIDTYIESIKFFMH